MAVQNLADLAATQSDSTETLGYLTWYSISDCLIKRDELAQNLLNCGLEEGWLPPAIREPDAFRKATKQVEQKRVPGKDKKIYNYLMREVSSDKYHIQRNIVLEVVDPEGKRLDYRPEEGILTLDKKNGTIDVKISPGSPAADVATEAERLFEIYKSHHDSRALRTMVYNMLAAMAPTPVRPSGGVYMVPATYKEQLSKVTQFLRELPGDSEGYMIPLIDNSENRDMMREKIREHLKNTINHLKDGLQNQKLDKANANILLDQAKRRLVDFKQYQKALHDEMDDMQELTSLIRAQVEKLLEKDI